MGVQEGFGLRFWECLGFRVGGVHASGFREGSLHLVLECFRLARPLFLSRASARIPGRVRESADDSARILVLAWCSNCF